MILVLLSSWTYSFPTISSDPQGSSASEFFYKADSIMVDDPDEALRLIRLGLAENNILADKMMQARGEKLTGKLALLKGSLAEATRHYKIALKIYQDKNRISESIEILRELAEAYQFYQELESALMFYNEAKNLATRAGLQREALKLSISIAQLLLEMKFYDKAIAAFKQTLEAASDHRWYERMAEISGSLGLIYIEMNEPDMAIAHLEKALEYTPEVALDKLGWKISLAQAFLMKNRGQETRALLKSIEADSTVLLPLLQARFFLISARVALLQNQVNQAKNFLHDGFSKIENTDRFLLKNQYYQSYEDLYRTSGNFAKAMEYMRLQMEVRDSIHLRDRIFLQSEIVEKLELKEKESELLLLEQKMDEKLRQSKWMRQSLVGSLLLLLVFTLLSLFTWKANRELQGKNQIIQTNLLEKETLLREIHHRVKNNLQLVSSMLSIQARSLKGTAGLEPLSRGKERVQSMALIHQHLYQEATPYSVNTREYIEALCHSFITAYRTPDQDISLKTEVEPLKVDIDTIIPLGIILNELISNAVRYAFLPGKTGEIQVSLVRNGDTMELKVSDNGKGWQEEETEIPGKLGYRLIKAFLQKLQGTYRIQGDRGTTVVCAFRNFQCLSLL